MRTFTVATDSMRSPGDLFARSLDIGEHVASLAHSGERAIEGVTSGRIGLGETVTWRARHFGVWFTMTSRITALDEPRMFVDEQIRGPFRSSRHEHLFEPRDGGTRMTDVVTLASPLFGFVLEPVLLVPYLRRLIVTRNRHLVGQAG